VADHPNVVKLVDLFETQASSYIVLELLQGGDLFQYLKARSFKLTEHRVRQLAKQLAEGIAYLHSLGIVHRDIKLENIMMTDTTEESSPKIIDFGLSKMIGPNEKSKDPFGTLGYVAPEILLRKPYSFSCDVWSLGCVVYAMMSGALPFDSRDSKSIITHTIESELKFEQPCWKNCSNDFIDFLSKTLTKNQHKRPSINEILRHRWFKTESRDKQSRGNKQRIRIF